MEEPLSLQEQKDSERVFALVHTIPSGHVMSYGQVGKSVDPTLDARTVGRIMGICPPDVPWWRVMGSTGELLIRKRSPHLAREQKQKLQAEGVQFIDEDRVDMNTFRYEFEAVSPDQGALEF